MAEIHLGLSRPILDPWNWRPQTTLFSGSEGGGKKDKEGKETAGPRRSARTDGKKGERTKALAQTRPEGIGLAEPGGSEPQKRIATRRGLGKSLKEKAIAAKNRVDSQRKNSI